jgi:hypothetical protein
MCTHLAFIDSLSKHLVDVSAQPMISCESSLCPITNVKEHSTGTLHSRYTFVTEITDIANKTYFVEASTSGKAWDASNVCRLHVYTRNH